MISRKAVSIRAFSALNSSNSFTTLTVRTPPPNKIMRFKVRRLGIGVRYLEHSRPFPGAESNGHFIPYMGDRVQLCEFASAGAISQ